MRMYYSMDSLYQNRKYRSVFASGEVDYLRCDLQLYNILFDEEDWKSKVVFKCFKSGTDKTSYDK